ncbi:PTS mannose/fructose/sorbose/N-acetylgalactosamine transporter subunit IIC [Anaerocolumna sp. MB42-C2]|uniref:PTS mannose/fructose/sorbose/N-acetylgalactosamine transporter subunit IIC n=1 Tax=Anaerocolumna sp. MB42-C2 TaxID=3070997 RepID=UPI0027E10994|nr:PTS sugar transporter subunit IIC [Anaerocolumna sp. MB42-C2]WMJ89142.1 PTS sugar transporter subunit IIC [Anaerocolumna sp. MB42-C2]
MLVQAILLGILGFLGGADWWIGTTFIHRPICFGAITGIILGDLQTGIIVGGALEILFIGAIAIGNTAIPDVGVAGILATAFAISLGKGTDVALALAMPIGMLSLTLGTLIIGPTRLLCNTSSYKLAEKGNYKGVYWMHFISGFITWTIKGLLVFGGFYFGADAVTSLISSMPKAVIDGMSIASGVLPAVGIAMLCQLIINKSVAPYFALGYVLASYFKIPMLGIAIIGLILVFAKFNFKLDNVEATANVDGVNDYENEF